MITSTASTKPVKSTPDRGRPLVLLLTAAVAMLASGATSAWAQADRTHYLPPLFARNDIGTHYLLVSTIETAAFDVTVTDGAGNVIDTGTDLQGVSRAASRTHEFAGTNYAQIGLLDETELNKVSTEGLIVTGPKPFLANIREKTAEQGGSLTSKGTFGLGTDFYSGHLISGTDQENTKAHFVSVMATEDDTDVVFDVSTASLTPFGGTGNPFSPTVTLDAGESYVIGFEFDVPAGDFTLDPNDVNGVHVTSDKPIAFTTGSWLAGNRDGNRKDIGIDQAVPVDRLGSRFIVIKGKATTNADLLERPGIVAAADGTDVFVGGSSTPAATLDAGDYFYVPATSYSAAGNMLITTSKPAYLYQSTSGNDSNSNAMNFIPPLRCIGTTDVVIPNADLVGDSEIGIIARAGASLTVTDLGGAVTLPSPAAVPGTSDWVTYNVNVDGDVDISSSNVINVSLVTSAGDRGSAGFFSGFADAPGIVVTGGTDLCETYPVMLTAQAGAGFASFQWYRDGNPIDGATGSTLEAFLEGNYQVAGLLIDDGSVECDGGSSPLSPAVNVNTAGCVCGDGDVDPTEECDDGNTVSDDGCSATCIIEFCGDGVDNNATEECDDGNTVANDGCGPTCQTEICGDSITQASEQCDDGNTVSGDGCSATCVDEFCGDNVVNDGGEECDDGNTIDGDGCSATCVDEFCGDNVVNDGGAEQCDDGNTTSDDGCSATCQDEFCGDGIQQASEECDDGNTVSNDGCSDACASEFCGDGVQQTSEECDDGNSVSNDGCSDVCASEFCGDGVQQTSEACDDGNTANNDGCSDTCAIEGCGDGITQASEECDDGNTVSNDGCSAACDNEFCGDGVQQTSEECDDGNMVSNDGCSDACVSEFCGDGVQQTSEECDDGNAVSNDGCSAACADEFCGDGVQQTSEGCDDGNMVSDDGCSATCAVEGCGDGIQQASEECDDGNTVDDDGCDSSCIDEFCGDGLINDVDEECDDGNANSGDGCDSGCDVENGFECSGEPSVCTPINPTLEQLFEGTWPDIDTKGQYIIFVSPEDLGNDSRIGHDNADANEEVYFLDLIAKKKHGLGTCIGGSNSGMSCQKSSDCPGALTKKPCGRYSQLTNTTGTTSLFSYTMVSNGGKAAVWTDTTAAVDSVPLFLRKKFEKMNLGASITTMADGTRGSSHRSGNVVAIESTDDITGGNPDGNSEIFVLNTKKNTWQQLTNTVAPVQNHRPLVTLNSRIMFDSDGDVANEKRDEASNPDGNRELFLARISNRKPPKIEQLTDTSGTDLVLGCAARFGRHAFFQSTGDLHDDPDVAGIDNADGNSEIFHWRRYRTPGGITTQQTDSIGGENVNVDCTPKGFLFVWESTSDLDNDGSSNRRVYIQSLRTGKRAIMSPASTGDSVRPRIGRRAVVFASTSDLTEKNPTMKSVIYIFDTTKVEEGLTTP